MPGQNIQHFMTNSPWSAADVLRQVRQEVATRAELQRGGVLVLDESAVRKAGTKTVGAARQWNGRIGHVDLSQVGTFLAYANGPVWTWIDGELFLPEHWFGSELAAERKRLGIPPARTFQTKVELGWQLIRRVQAEGLPFDAVGCDELYGQSGWLRARLDAARIVYLANVPADTRIYREAPRLEVPETPPGHIGPHFKRPPIQTTAPAIEARALAVRPDTAWHRVQVRPVERGALADEFAAWRVWTIRDDAVAQEWLLVRRTSQGKCSYTLSNAPPDTPLERLAHLRCQRYWVEHANQDAKSEAGWDELQAQKYRAWEHHLALTILATWFVAETKLDWARDHPRDPSLVTDFATTDRLPNLSVANVRSMLRAALPLPDLTPDRAAALVVEHPSTAPARVAAVASVSSTSATTPDPNVTLSRHARSTKTLISPGPWNPLTSPCRAAKAENVPRESEAGEATSRDDQTCIGFVHIRMTRNRHPPSSLRPS